MMAEKKNEIMASYPYMTAGKTWVIPNVALDYAPDGSVMISGLEIKRMQRIVANEICGQASTLTPEELEFLCDVTSTRFNDVADFLSVTKGSVTFWKRPGKNVPLNESLRLKKWFWKKVFASDLVNLSILSVSTLVLTDDGKLLEFLREQGKIFFSEALKAG